MTLRAPLLLVALSLAACGGSTSSDTGNNAQGGSGGASSGTAGASSGGAGASQAGKGGGAQAGAAGAGGFVPCAGKACGDSCCTDPTCSDPSVNFCDADGNCLTGAVSCPAPCCGLQEAAGEGACEKLLGVRWTAFGCESLSGCLCQGKDCGALYASVDACKAAHSTCPGVVACEGKTCGVVCDTCNLGGPCVNTLLHCGPFGFCEPGPPACD